MFSPIRLYATRTAASRAAARGFAAALCVLSAAGLVPARSQTAPPSAFANPVYVRQLPVGAADIVYNPGDHKLYASLPGSFGRQGNSVVAVDPWTGVMDAPVAVGPEPRSMAVSADGAYLYIVLSGAHKICRFNLKTHRSELQFAFGSGDAPVVRVCPSKATRVAVVRRNGPNGAYENLGLFDSGVDRLGTGSARIVASAITFSADGSRLYAFDGTSPGASLQRWTLGADGLTQGDQAAGLIADRHQDMIAADGLLYLTNGQVIDPEKREVKGTFPGASGVVLMDGRNARVLFIHKQAGGCVISAYDPQKFAAIGETAYPKIAGDPASAQLCGNVYAFLSGGKIVLLTPSPGLLEACKTRKWEEAFAALDGSVNVNCQDQVGSTALMWAAYSGQIPLCAKLIEKGADLKLADARGATALHFAVSSGSLPLVTLLLRKGADPNALGLVGTPLKVASDMRRPDILHLLQQYGGK